MATLKVGKPAVAKVPKVSLPKPKTPKAMSMTTKAPSSSSSMGSYKAASTATNGLKGAISKNQLKQLSTATTQSI